MFTDRSSEKSRDCANNQSQAPRNPQALLRALIAAQPSSTPPAKGPLCPAPNPNPPLNQPQNPIASLPSLQPEKQPNPTLTSTSPELSPWLRSSKLFSAFYIDFQQPSPTNPKSSPPSSAPLTVASSLPPVDDQSFADPVEFAIRHLQFNPDPEQSRILRAIVPRGILNCSRQWGKSTLTAMKAVHRAYLQPKALILVVSPGARQSALFIERAAAFLLELGIKRRGDTHHNLCLQLPNGSRIIGIPAVDATIRGFSSVSLLIIDEAARVPDNIYHAVRPMLATTGATVRHPAFPATPELWLLSTPFGCRGFFYEEWSRSDTGDPKIDWQRFSITADKCPRIPPSFLQEERNRLPQPYFEQVYFCKFIREGTNSLFRWKELQAALDPNIKPLFPTWSFTKWLHR